MFKEAVLTYLKVLPPMTMRKMKALLQNRQNLGPNIEHDNPNHEARELSPEKILS
jgi:hypothetical protein